MGSIINIKDLEHMAKLAKIKLSYEEAKKEIPHFSKILDYINKLNELNTDNIPPTTHVVDLKNVLREDFIKPSLDKKDVLKNAPEKESGCFKVPKII